LYRESCGTSLIVRRLIVGFGRVVDSSRLSLRASEWSNPLALSLAAIFAFGEKLAVCGRARCSRFAVIHCVQPIAFWALSHVQRENVANAKTAKTPEHFPTA